MKSRAFSVLAAAVVMLVSVLACGGSISTANIADAWMSADEGGDSRTTTFSQDAIFYAQVDLKNAPDDTKLKASWYAVNADGVDPNFLIDETEFTSGVKTSFVIAILIVGIGLFLGMSPQPDQRVYRRTHSRSFLLTRPGST